MERDSISAAVLKRKILRNFMDPVPEELPEAREYL